MIFLHNKEASWDRKLNSYVLNFQGRANQVNKNYLFQSFVVITSGFKWSKVVLTIDLCFLKINHEVWANYRTIKLNIVVAAIRSFLQFGNQLLLKTTNEVSSFRLLLFVIWHFHFHNLFYYLIGLSEEFPAMSLT